MLKLQEEIEHQKEQKPVKYINNVTSNVLSCVILNQCRQCYNFYINCLVDNTRVIYRRRRYEYHHVDILVGCWLFAVEGLSRFKCSFSSVCSSHDIIEQDQVDNTERYIFVEGVGKNRTLERTETSEIYINMSLAMFFHVSYLTRDNTIILEFIY